MNKLTTPEEVLHQRILSLQGVRVRLDAVLALLYGVESKRFSAQLRLHRRRFPDDFMFN